MTEVMYVNAVATLTQWNSRFRMDTEARLKTVRGVYLLQFSTMDSSTAVS